LGKLVASLADVLLPQTCVVCGRRCRGGALGLACEVCWCRVAWLPQPQCSRCGYPQMNRECSWCRLLPPFVRAARSAAWVPGGVAGALVHLLKYSGWWQVAEGIAARLARLQWPKDVIAERDAIVPVPLSHRRLVERGYNQSEHIAHSLARYWQIPVWRALKRTVATRAQARLTGEARLHNVAGAFEVVVPGAFLEGRHLILLDDVVTTGATLNSCAAALFAAGTRTISYVTFGRARLPGDAPPTTWSD
jgi:ComF family protein